jgi:uncharacterized membrane protein YkvI
MKPTAKVIGLFGIIQLTIIALAWFATRSFRKIHLVAAAEGGWVKPARGLSEFFAVHGLWFLIIPPLWCFLMSWGNDDTERASDTADTVKAGLVFTVILFIACAFAFMDMVLTFSTVLKVKD